ncbi:MAG TPA: alpha/beta hydrolase-fold protein [Pyrinomonadaceae bacterium]|nr:alpha/beta hydrolase-fold protein [Pyrinomonadaceae bacterium]
MTPHDTRAPRLRWPAAIFGLLLCAASAAAQGQPPYDAPARFQLKSAVLGEERTILVRTPPGYERGEQRFPVLYMTDGDAHLLHTSGTVNFLARNGRIPEMIVVGITNTDRTRDLTPTRSTAQGPNGALQLPTSGGADKFLKFIETELIPHVEKQYRTQPFRALAGHSFGGLFALHAMTARPELFNAYIAVSPSTQWEDFQIVKRVEEFFKGRKDWNRTLYVSLGHEPGNITTGFEKLKAVLDAQKTQGFSWDSATYDDEDHGSVVLRSHYAGLRKVFEGWQVPREARTGRFAGGLREVEEHYRKLSARLGYAVVMPEFQMNVFGYQLLNDGETEDAIAAFKLNAERYPRSANVYDSLAEAYERAGKLDLAQQLYAKAVAVGTENSDPALPLFRQNQERVAGLLNKQQPANAAGNR